MVDFWSGFGACLVVMVLLILGCGIYAKRNWQKLLRLVMRKAMSGNVGTITGGSGRGKRSGSGSRGTAITGSGSGGGESSGDKSVRSSGESFGSGSDSGSLSGDSVSSDNGSVGSSGNVGSSGRLVAPYSRGSESYPNRSRRTSGMGSSALPGLARTSKQPGEGNTGSSAS